MVTNKENLFKLGKKMTDRALQMLGIEKITEKDPEYWGMVNILDDDMVDIALCMPDKRVGITLSELAAKTGWEEDKLKDKLQEMGEIGLIEWNWETPDHHQQYVLPRFVPGAAEFFNMRKVTTDAHPEVCEFFYQMARLPLEAVTPMVPPGGAGIGMHVIPVEKAIPAKSQSVDLEHLSHWLDKYDYFSVGICSCRRSQQVRGEGSGEVEDYWCLAVGDCARYCDETKKDGKTLTKEQAIELLQRAEEEGFVHQITNIDGENKIFAICNCAPGVCYALRTSQLFNTPNMSRSAYTAYVDKSKCVACGKCVEVCPAGAAKLGQKLCTKTGPVQYPKHELPDDTPWGPDKWDEDWRNSNQLQCYESGTAPCKTACPAHIAIQGYIKMAAEGRYDEALALIKKDNPLPAICGYICNRRCEDACTRGTIDAPIAIDEIKKFIAEREINEKDRYIPPIRSRKSSKSYEEKMAVIGAGPAGLSCAFFLANMGYPVTVFEKEEKLGGMLTLGIPSYRLPRNIIDAEIDVLKTMGVTFVTGVEIGKDKSLDDLRNDGFKAFCLGIGAQKSAALGIPGEDLKNVVGGIDFMKQVNLGKDPEIAGKKVLVIGGGNVAMDVARTAIRYCDDVTVVYRRKESDMPADKAEVAEAKEEGVKFAFESKPVEVLGKSGKATALKCENAEFEADVIIAAVGQKVDIGGIDPDKFAYTEKGTVIGDDVTYQTAVKDVFVAGDAVTGPKFAIDAIASGREAAESMHRSVHHGTSLTMARNLRKFYELNKEDVVVTEYDNSSRQVNDRIKKNFKTDKCDIKTFTEEQVKKEAARCLGCGACEVDENQCIGCGLCTTRCEFDAIHLLRDHPEATAMYTAEDKFSAIIPYIAKREIKIIKKKLSGKK